MADVCESCKKELTEREKNCLDICFACYNKQKQKEIEEHLLDKVAYLFYLEKEKLKFLNSKEKINLNEYKILLEDIESTKKEILG